MRQASWESVYSDVVLLSEADRYKLYNQMRQRFYQEEKIVAYTTLHKPLTKSEYIEQINKGLRQIENGEMIADDDLRKEIEAW